MLTAIRITDPYIISLVEAEQARSKETTATKTAARLIVERLTLKESGDLKQHAPTKQNEAVSAA